MSKFLSGLKRELVEAIPPFVFFFVAFHLLALTQALMRQEYHIEPHTVMNATIGALIVAKVILLADLVPFVNRFPDRPLAYNVVWKTLLYQGAAIVVAYLERLWDFYRQYGGVAAANEHMIEEVIWPHFWATQMWLFVLFLLYCTLRELSRALGQARMKALFFGPLPAGG